MKKSKLSLAALSVASVLSSIPIANAAIIDEVEFHGYFRAGFFASKENDFKKADIGGQKEQLGRLGLESDNDGNFGFTTITNINDDQQLRIHIGVGDTEFDDLIGYLEMDGVLPSGTLWGGKRKLAEENYVFMTDFFYTDLEGIGAGVHDYEIGDGFLDIAYISSERENSDSFDDYDDFAEAGYNSTLYQNLYTRGFYSDSQKAQIKSNLNNPMHTLHASYTLGAMTLHANYKYLPNNWDLVGKPWADTGYDATAIYHMLNFFGLEGNAFSYAILQAGKGLGSGNLLGGTITAYSATRPGSLTQGYKITTPNYNSFSGDPHYLLTHRNEDATSARAILWGGYTNSDGIGFFPSIQAQYNDEGKNDWDNSSGSHNYWVSAMMRNIFPVKDNFIVQTEVGYYENVQSGGHWHQSKITVAPTFVLSDGLSTAEIRFTATYLPISWTTGVEGNRDIPQTDDFVFGIQADAYW
ncbi:maltoporin [Enterovibrio norvegicus]|uniref:carbohydrate porin n=1 Tax=Enterovibrio norvegicus TaxID=188144 RepID=UPI000C842042|nr:carbohydrate porin [Enterovibrio norvegicus]MCC4800324.1 carbohydrate porin [Enterovibrio norvegicus]PMI29778.1 maltoporin [Enterovibrio norvegicus]PMI38847.1 maltoporin [Enterovibrio norvegicus]PMN51092.1 maltoporin [Enterovibrio norvegicus]TKF08575.1 carbohydrate porin [Enterovibrio norvegicus]